jgi:serine/threonine protein kinase
MNIIPWQELTPAPAPTALRQGGMGIVLRGTWQAPRRAPRDVAVKVIKAALLPSASQASALAALQSEASAMVAASDGNLNEFVAQLYGLAQGPAPAAWLAALGAGALACQLQPEGGSGSGGGGGGDDAPAQLLALVMRWEEGGTLAELLHSPTRAWGAGTGERLALCAQIASGLRALHYCSAGTIVHGDIKAENVLLSHAPGLHGAPRPRITVSASAAGASTRPLTPPPAPPLTPPHTHTSPATPTPPPRRTLALLPCARLPSAAA